MRSWAAQMRSASRSPLRHTMLLQHACSGDRNEKKQMCTTTVAEIERCTAFIQYAILVDGESTGKGRMVSAFPPERDPACNTLVQPLTAASRVPAASLISLLYSQGFYVDCLRHLYDSPATTHQLSNRRRWAGMAARASEFAATTESADWEQSKENFQPLKAGRKPGALKDATVDLRKQEIEENRRWASKHKRKLGSVAATADGAPALLYAPLNCHHRLSQGFLGGAGLLQR